MRIESGKQFGWALVALGSIFTVLPPLQSWALSKAPSPPVGREVAVVVGPQAPKMEVYAGEEMCLYLNKLFGIDVQPTMSVPGGDAFLFLVGSPPTNPAVRRATAHGFFPRVTDQGIVLRPVELGRHKALLVGGGSPKATLWAVYELARRWGVNFLLRGDVLPAQSSFQSPNLNVVIEPKLRARQWRVLNEFPMGPASWGMADYRPVIDQLAKLKFNRLLIVLWPFSPYLDYEVDGIHRSSAAIFFGYHFPITPDMVGRQLYGNEKEFWNPDLPIDASYKDFAAAGEKLVRNLIAYAHERGMECLLGLTPTHFPVEFAPLLRDGMKVRIVGVDVMAPSAATDIDDPTLAKLSATVIQSAVNTYPEADGLDLTMPEHRQWTGVYERAWNALNHRYGIEKVRSISAVLDEAGHRETYPGGTKRAVDEVKGDIASLYFYDRLFEDLKILKGTRHPDVKLEIDAIAEELYPIISKVLPPGAEVLNFVDYTPSRIVSRQQVLKEVQGQTVPSLLIYTLNDDNIGPVPQLTTGSLYTLTQDLIQYGWAGFSTRYWNIGDQDSNVSYLSRAAWEAGVKPDDISRDQLRAVCGEGCIVPVLDAFYQVQKATIGLEWNALSFAFPVPGMLMKYWKATPVPSALAECQSEYQTALEDVRQAKAAVTGSDADNYLGYWEGRLEFAVDYFNTVEDVNRAATAEAAGRQAETLEDAQKALDSVRQGLTSFARVARDQSDRGAIVMLNEYAFRPLVAKINALKNQPAQ